MKQYLQDRLKEKNITFTNISEIQGEASTRVFYRIHRENRQSLVAMVYPDKAPAEIAKIIRLIASYQEFQLNVPIIEECLDHRIILMQDLGDQLLQHTLSSSSIDTSSKQQIVKEIAEILIKLKNIPWRHTSAVLDNARMKWEMDFFLTHYAAHFIPACKSPEAIVDLRTRVYKIVDAIGPNDTFAHRDFHSRNLLLHQGKIWMVDFQDSLIAPAFYDIVSFAFDAYLDLYELRQCLLESLKSNGIKIDEEQYYLQALQRNIKALGTFGFQITERKNLVYDKYIPRTINHIRNNPMLSSAFGTPSQSPF